MDLQTIVGADVARILNERAEASQGERGEALAALGASLSRLVQERLTDEWEWDSRYVSLDGIREMAVDMPASRTLRILGALYVMDDHGHRLQLCRAELSTEPGATSTVEVASEATAFDLPRNERQFVAGIERAAWRYRIELQLTSASSSTPLE